MCSKGPTYDVAFMPDGKALLSGGPGLPSTLRHWDITSLSATPTSTRSKHLSGHVVEVEEQTLPDREFSGHTVRA